MYKTFLHHLINGIFLTSFTTKREKNISKEKALTKLKLSSNSEQLRNKRFFTDSRPDKLKVF